MNKIQEKRLLKLATFLDELPAQKFNYAIVARLGHKPMKEALKAKEESCGSVACAVGWLPALFPREFRWTDPRRWDNKMAVLNKANRANLDAAATWFGLSWEESRLLFDPGHNNLSFSATPKEVAEHIRNFIKEKKKAA